MKQQGCFTPISSHETAKRSAGKFLAARALQRNKQCIMTICRLFFFTLVLKLLVSPTTAAAPSAKTLVHSSHFGPPFSKYSNVTPKKFLSCWFLWQGLAKYKVFSDCGFIHKVHVGQELNVSTYISRLTKLERKFIIDMDLVQNRTVI